MGEEGELDPRAPRCNPDLVGHEAAEARLLEAWTSGRMHHAWLINGPRGIGKATLAYRMARFVLSGGGEGGGGLRGQHVIKPGHMICIRQEPVARIIGQFGGLGFDMHPLCA